MTVFIEIMGPRGSGKTTLAETMAHEFPGQSLLVIDASADQKLTTLLCLDPPTRNIADTLSTLCTGHLAPKNEAIDWAFHDLPVTVGDDLDLIACGKNFFTPLPEQQGEQCQKVLAYGLTRLCRDYDCVVLDGFDAGLHALLPPDQSEVLVVSLPDVTVSPLPSQGVFERTPGLVVNRVAGSSLSPILESMIAESFLRLVGRIPHYASENELETKLPEAFRNCLLRLDIPLFSKQKP